MLIQASATSATPYLAGEQVMWVAVVTRAVLDSLGQASCSVGPASLAMIRDAARAWLTRSSDDRDAVLDLAGLSRGWLEKKLPRLLELWAKVDAGEALPRQALRKRREPGRKAREPPSR